MATVRYHSTRTKIKFMELTDRWDNCNRCGLGSDALHKVYFRGDLPAKFLFIGEAPGKTEDILGYPFVGQAGTVLNEILSSVEEKTGKFRYAIANIMGCFPRDVEGRARPPDLEEVECCLPRLQHLIQLAKPEAFILMGATAANYSPVPEDYPLLEIFHPAYLLRQGGRKSPHFKPTVRLLIDFIRDQE